ncbi:MAG: C39 family peptidase [Candidatus Methanoperedens sp.]|nr:C39 family peptidase [Candidatus Methanoperedens sp.]
MLKGKKILNLAAAILLVTALFTFIGLAGSMGEPASGYKEEDYYVQTEKALEHAKVKMMDFVLSDTPGLEGWKGASINPTPLILYDLNGKKLYYEFSVEKDGKVVGRMKVGASTVLGNSVKTFELGPRKWNGTLAVGKAKEIVQKQYPNSEIRSVQLIVYSYPKIGVMVTTYDMVSGKENTTIMDVSSYSIISNVADITAIREGASVAWSLYDHMSIEDRKQGIEKWKKYNNAVNKTKEKLKSLGFDLNDKSLTEGMTGKLNKETVGITSTSQYMLNVALYGQETDYYCAPASGKMMADYHGLTHSQNHVAGVMGTTTSGTTNGGQLTYFTTATPNGLGKTGSSIDSSPTWDEAKAEVNNNRPLHSLIPGHTRLARGWKTETDWWFFTTYYLFINDPWPVNSGDNYWEDWDTETHTYYIYARN